MYWVSWAGISPWLLSLASLKLFPTSSLELPLRTYGCGEPLQTAQLIAIHFREKPVALLSYHNPQTGNPSSFVARGELKWWLLTGQSFEQILSGGMSTGMILILVFSALIVVSASIAALRACWVAAQFFWRSKKTVFRKLQQDNRTCNFNSWMWLLRAQICEIAMVRSEGAQAASGFCSPETGLSAAAILVLFECLEHPEWQIQKDAIMRLESRAARDVVRETLIKHAVGLPDTPAVSSRHDPMIFPAKNFTRRDREIVKALAVLVHEKLEVVGQVQNCCPAELAMKAVGTQWCQTTLKHRNPEVYLAFAIAFPWAKGHVHMHCFAGLEDKNSKVRMATVQCLGSFCVNLVQNPTALQFPGNKASKNLANLNDGPSLFESVISALAGALKDKNNDVQDSVREAFKSFWIAFDKFDEKLMLQETDVGQASDSHGPTHRTSASALVTEMKAAMWQCCLNQGLLALQSKNWRIRYDAVQLIGMCAENQIKNLASWLTPAGDEFRANMAKLNDVPSLFESVISALADALGDEDGDVRRSVREAFKSFWIAFDKFDERLMLQETDVGQASDSHDPAYRSSGCASVTEVKAAIWQCCLDRCLLALKSKDSTIRRDAVLLIGMCAENQIKNLASGMKPSGNEVHGFSLTNPAVAKMLGDKEAAVRRTVPEALGSFLNAFAEFPDCLPFKTSCSDGPGPADLSSGSTAPTRSKASLLRCCLQGCMVALQDEDEGTKCAAALALGKIIFGYVNPEIAATLEDLLSSSQAFLSALGKNGAGCSFIVHGFGEINSVTEVAAMRQCCLNQGLLALKSKNQRIRRDAVQLIGVFAENQIKNLASWLTPAGDEFRANMAKLNDVPSLFESVISALADALGDEDGDVRRSVREAFKSFWIAFDKFDERLMLQETDVGQASDSHGPAYRSSGCASVTEVKAAMWQCCLDRCLLALQSENLRIRRDAVQLIGVFAENQIKNLASWLTPAGDEFRANMAKLNDVPSLFESVISALADALGDEDGDVRGSVREAFKSFWIAFDKFDEQLMLQETDVGQASDSHGPAYRSSGCASVTEVKAAMWQCCLDRCLLALKSKDSTIRRDAVLLIGMCAENQIKNRASGMKPSGNEVHGFSLTNPAVAKMLGDKEAAVRRTVPEALGSFLNAFAEFPDCLPFKTSCSDGPGPADLSSGSTAPTRSKASLLRCCLQGCMVALQDEDEGTKCAAALALGKIIFGYINTEIAATLEDLLSSSQAFLSALGKNGAGCSFIVHGFGAINSLTEVAAMRQCCLNQGLLALKSKNWRIRRDAVQLIDVFKENQIKNLASWLTPAGDEFRANMAKLNDVPSLFESVISALADALGDEDGGVRDSVREAFKSFWIAVDKFDEKLMLQETNVGQASDSHDPAYRSSGCASVTEVKAAMWQCCLDRCLLALKSKNWRTRNYAVQLIGVFAENQIKNLASWLTPAGDEFRGGVSWFELTIPTVVKLLGDEAAVRQTVIKVLVSCFESLQKVAQVAHQSFIVFLIECSIPAIVESLSHDDLKRSAARAIESIWHTLEKVGEDRSLSDEAEPDAFSPSTSLGPVKTQMASSCLDGFRALLSDDDRSVRLVAAKVLRMCENHKIKSLALALRDPERGVPVSATELQREITSFEGIVIALSPLVEDLSEMKADEKVTAIEVVGSFWDCLNEFDEHVMLKATEVCCNSEQSRCIDSLQRMKTLVLEDSRVTHAHQRRLEFIKKLESLLEDLDSEARWAATLELCNVGLPFAEAMVLEFLSKDKFQRNKHEGIRFAQSTRALAKSVASCQESDRCKRVDKAMTLFLEFIAAGNVKVQKLGLEAVRIIGRQGLPVLVRTLEHGSPEEQTAAAVGLWAVEKDFFLTNPTTLNLSTKLAGQPPGSEDAMRRLQENIEDRLYGKHPASLADPPTSLPVVQAGRDREMKNRFVASWEYSMGLVVDLPSPWTLVASAAAFVLFSSQHPLAELLSHPNTLVRSHHHRHWGFPMYGSWLLEKGLESRHSWEAHVRWFRGSAVPSVEPFKQVLSLDEEERFCAALQAFQLVTRFEVVPKSDLCDPSCIAVFARYGLKIKRNEEGKLVLSSNPRRPRLLNVEAIERIVQRGFFPERFHDTSPVLHVLRPWWLLVDIVVVLLQVAICVLIMIIPLALFSVHELARESFYPMSPVDSLTSAHFGPRFAQLSERLLFASPTLTWFSAIYAAALFGSLVFAYCTEALPLAPFPILQTLMGNKSTSVVRQQKRCCDKMAMLAKVFFKAIPWLAFALFFAQVFGFGALFCCWLGFGVIVEPGRFVPLVSTWASFVFAVAGRVRSLLNWRRSLAKRIDEIFQRTANILWISLLERMNIDSQTASYQRLLEGTASDMDLFQLLAQGRQSLCRSSLEEFLKPLIDQRALAMLVNDIVGPEDRASLTKLQ